MKFNHPHIFLWDEMETSQVPVKTQDDGHHVTKLWQASLSACLSDEAALLIFMMFLALD
jgi:hypothetical protein